MFWNGLHSQISPLIELPRWEGASGPWAQVTLWLGLTIFTVVVVLGIVGLIHAARSGGVVPRPLSEDEEEEHRRWLELS